jgi:hypothetical protein
MTMMMVGQGPGGINTQNKFNTISNIHKRGAGGGENSFEILIVIMGSARNFYGLNT